MQNIIKNRIILIKTMTDIANQYNNFKFKLLEIINAISKDDFSFLSLSSDSPDKVSFTKSYEDKYNEKYRTKISLQRYFRRYLSSLTSSLSDHIVNDFCVKVIARLDTSISSKIKLLNGDSIVEYYNDTNIRSCMTGSCSAHKISFYAKNKDNINLVVYNNEVRAFLWLCYDGHFVLDRAYPAQHCGIFSLRQWAVNKGYLLRTNPDALSYDYNNQISDNKTHSILLKHDNIFPYMDTFKYGKINGKNIIVSNSPYFGNIVLSNTDGGFATKLTCNFCEDTLTSDTYHCKISFNNKVPICSKCFLKTAFICSICRKTYLNSFKYRNWKICNECHDIGKTFLIYNKCSCEICSSKKTLYLTNFIDMIKKESHEVQLNLNLLY